MELEAAQHAGEPRLVRRPDRARRRVGRQIVEHHADAIGLGIVHVDELAHALCEVVRGALLGDFGVSPGTVHVDKHEHVRGAVAAYS